MANGDNDRRDIFVVLATTMITLIVLSLLPWGDFSNNLFKEFSLFSDIIPQSDKTYITHEELDPELEALRDEHDELAATDAPHEAAPVTNDPMIVTPLPESFQAPVRDGNVLIEDYSADGSGLASLRDALSGASSGVCRIVIIGDSYIEGDILAQDIRSQLQDQYGGSGVGYMSAFTQFPGFRQSVTQSGQGWKGVEIRKMSSDDYRILAGQYFIGSEGATAKYKGTKHPAHTDSWTRSTILFIAPEAGTITVNASDDFEQVYDIAASTDVQAIVIDRPVTEFAFTSDIDGLIHLGTWLDNPSGVQVDCMSLRGNSGVSHRNLNLATITQMRRYINYDLIILEFGINALSSEQSDYTYYGNAMAKTVAAVREAYPDAAILMLGIGDRGQKQGTEVGSMSTAPAMVLAQRETARRTGAMFWDTRAAMGGDGAVVDWHKRGLINADYIHLNHKGGKELATIFVNSINSSIQ